MASARLNARMRAYREGTAPFEATLWYGPFPYRLGPTLLLLALAVLIALVGLDEERTTIRGVECTRPGPCMVRRGADWLGVRDAETFDASRIDRAELRRTKGKNPRSVLYLVDDRGEDIPLTEGSNAGALFPLVQPFFADPSRPSLSAHVDFDLGGRAFFVLAVTGLLFAALLAQVHAARRAGHYRITIEGGGLRVERMILGRPSRARVVRCDLIASVDVARGPNLTARVVLGTREGPDVPLTERFLPPSVVHEELAQQLRDGLKLER